MTINDVITKLSVEMAETTGDYGSMSTYRRYISMALSIGIEHFRKDMHEIVAMKGRYGTIHGRYRSVQEASTKLGISRKNISLVLSGDRPSAGGYLFAYSRPEEILKEKKTA